MQRQLLEPFEGLMADNHSALTPDLEKTGDIVLSGLGGAAAYYLTMDLQRLKKLSPLTRVTAFLAIAAAGGVAGHLLYQHIEDDVLQRKLLGG